LGQQYTFDISNGRNATIQFLEYTHGHVIITSNMKEIKPFSLYEEYNMMGCDTMYSSRFILYYMVSHSQDSNIYSHWCEISDSFGVNLKVLFHLTCWQPHIIRLQ
jgi:hypothetical protein